MLSFTQSVKNMYHILFVIDFFPPHKGGVETVFDNVTQRLLAKGYKVTVLTTRHDKQLPPQETNKNLTIYRVGSTRINFLRYAFRKGQQLLREDKSIDFIHTSTYGGAIPAALLAKRFGKKVIITVHEIFGKLWYRYKKRTAWLYHWFEKMIFRCHYDAYLCVSRYTCNMLRVVYGVTDAKLHIVYNGIDDAWNPENIDQNAVATWKQQLGTEGKFTALYYGHAGISKGIDYLVEALPAMFERVPNFRFVIVLLPSRRRDTIIKRLREITIQLHHPKKEHAIE